MKLNKRPAIPQPMREILALLLAFPLAACGGGGGGSSPSYTAGVSLPAITGDNVIPLTVNGSNCSSNSYTNKPCVTVTVCTPGSTTQCVTVNDVLLDTGSFGLRLFKSTLPGVTLTQVNTTTTGGSPQTGSLAECILYGDNSTQWGPVVKGDIYLGNEPVLAGLNMQLIDSTFSTLPTGCANSDATPAAAGLNGILGVGVLDYDCGSGCQSGQGNPLYYECSGATCTLIGTAAGPGVTGSNLGPTLEVRNPVAAFAVPSGLSVADNNGVVVELPGLVDGGQLFADGYILFGIGTRANNTPGSSVNVFKSDTLAEFNTSFNGDTYGASFLDTGSNGLFFNASGDSDLKDCNSWFCPTSLLNLSAVMIGRGVSGTTATVAFKVGNFTSLSNTANQVFAEQAGDIGSGSQAFDWGLPFFYGRTTYVGISGQTATIDGNNATGPYWAF